MSRPVIHIDFETFCELNLSLVGKHAYTRHPSFDLICMAYQIDDGDLQLWTPYIDQPEDFLYAIKDGGVIKGFNVEFEAACIDVKYRQLGLPAPLPINRYRCTMALAWYNGYAGGLGFVAEAMGLPEKYHKNAEGNRLIHKLCKPRKPSKANPLSRLTPRSNPDDFAAFYAYCKQDVVAERAVAKRLPIQQLPDSEQIQWQFTVKQNSRGLAVDTELIDAAIRTTTLVDTRLKNLTQTITNNSLTSIKQNVALAQYLGMASVDKLSVKKALETAVPGSEDHKLLEIRQIGSLSSVAKYKKLKSMSYVDGRVRDYLKYYGASRTGRFSGAGIQIQNLTKTDDWTPDELEQVISGYKKGGQKLETVEDTKKVALLTKKLIRPCLVADTDKRLLVSDYTSIECVLLHWLAGDRPALKRFAEDIDSYKFFATKMFDVPYNKVTPEQRRIAKPAVLGLGYQMGAKRYLSYTKDDYGVVMTPEEATKTVALYRSVNKLVVKLWYDLYRAAEEAMTTGERVYISKVQFQLIRGNLYCRLPSGRVLSYVDAKIQAMPTAWGDLKETITYKFKNDKNKWVYVSTFPGKLAENITQAVAGDVLRHGQLNAERGGYPVYATVHDEVLTQRAIGQGSIEELNKLLADLPDWGKDIPLSAGGYESYRYKKD